jgi:hypothetical protein
VVLHHDLYLEARFLFLVQALEIYHAISGKFESRELPKQQHKEWVSTAVEALPAELRDWAKGKLLLNSRSLSQKLVDIFKAHQAEATQLFDDLESKASRIAYTRNYYTHYHDEVDSERLIPEAEMWRFCYALEAILWIALLAELQIGGSAVDRVLNRARNLRFIHLNA